MNEYVRSMRKLIGKQCLLLCGASVIVLNAAGEILLQRRKDNGCWGYHGGSVEPDEIVEQAARRELLEETGLVAESLELFDIFSGPELHYVYPNGDEVSVIDIVFICRAYSGELQAQESEVTDFGFFALDALPENISPPQQSVLKAVVNRLTT